MSRIIENAGALSGSIRLPGDKSISHRALILGSICEGSVVIENLSTAEDVASTIDCLKQLGVEITAKNGTVNVFGRGINGYSEPENTLDCGNSGTTLRLLSGMLSGQQFYSILTGDASLRRRPMGRIVEPLKLMGAKITGRNHSQFSPLSIVGGKLKGVDYKLPVASAQVKTALMIAGLYSDEFTTLTGEIRSRDHSERMLEYFSAGIKLDEDCIRIREGSLTPAPIYIPGDISSASFFLGAAVLVPGSEISIENVGINKTRTGFIEVLQSMGANIDMTQTGCRNNEPFGKLTAAFSKLMATDIVGPMIPSLVDEIPLLSLLATRAIGTTVISGAEELRYKESDRLTTIANQLNKMGANIKERPDGLIIKGPTKLKGAVVDSCGDHRIAMTLSIAGMIADGETELKNEECIKISLSEFYDRLNELGA